VVTREEDLAYDGSNAPPKRKLTARERDIICRLINDDLYAIRKSVEWHQGYRGHGQRPYEGRTSQEEVPILQGILKAINPRTDW
jgi:hypothetical protein